ncbi:DUF6530 family protein [Morganella morganii]|uniref:DUF6530 family protein n=1 Tax=Morganella morganii TaxID=582 RepID=UPI0028D5EB71|nr:DUF6530 family protein [Morganella morganii]WNP29070.1 DUF6530 family protein [Morganella morganii]
MNKKDIPAHLSHKPVIKLESYSDIDGEYAKNTDAQGLSIGIAMWSEPQKPALSAKVWRHTGEKWSRQSEELPLHRVIDLATLICAAKLFSQNDELPIDINNKFNISLTHDRKLIDTLKNGFKRDTDKEYNLDKALTRLSAYLKKIGY